MPQRHERVTTTPDFELPPELQDFLDRSLEFVQDQEAVNEALVHADRSDLLIKEAVILPSVDSPDHVVEVGVQRIVPGDEYQPPHLNRGNNFPLAFVIPGPNGRSITPADLIDLRDGIYMPKPTVAFSGIKPFVERMQAILALRGFTENLMLKMSAGDPDKTKYLCKDELYVANILASAGLVDKKDREEEANELELAGLVDKEDPGKEKYIPIDDRYLVS